MFRAFAVAAVATLTIGLAAGLSELSEPSIQLAQCQPGYYKNSSGNCVEKPDQNPNGTTAVCCDGTSSHSQTSSGTCSHHGGVCKWNSVEPGYSDNARQEWA
ncbi:hypothetical protein BST27_29215 [Mycobacterium intermedium]|uniref:DUF3761 domain-containing protein n=1 Tax=Mycobacterium intermedium TaxID=28445 RepID=A0A1E3S2W0_MYCIE|nr:DUF3761 domain-containing protein [Mycobacterium intermedium]MCV6966080.1 DUF3761 domain-containing protein [Mycobacterium intermedium]ODQ96506.1 hypothetical protein BHQ20_28840 [Mycobacterium intermedium]OPE48846.1 hypothetical protein BV508_16340 [Mycobacterium intermedium]ORA91819.1 hypothetical protein BST27_29215 [Mycobacterium intermedium]